MHEPQSLPEPPAASAPSGPPVTGPAASGQAPPRALWNRPAASAPSGPPATGLARPEQEPSPHSLKELAEPGLAGLTAAQVKDDQQAATDAHHGGIAVTYAFLAMSLRESDPDAALAALHWDADRIKRVWCWCCAHGIALSFPGVHFWEWVTWGVDGAGIRFEASSAVSFARRSS